MDMDSKLILGMDRKVAALTNQKVTGRQVTHEDLNIRCIIPHLDLKLIESSGFQDTLLEVSQLTN